MKFSVILSSAILAANVVLAHAPNETPQAFKPYEVRLNNPGVDFSVKGTALYMQPYANNLDYGAEALPFNYGINRPITSPSWVIPRISTDYHFGFLVGLKGNIHDAHSNLTLDWERYHSPNDTDHLNTASSNDMVGPFFEIGPDASPYTTSKGSAKFEFDQVNLDFGTYVQFGDQLNVNLFSGVGYARIKESLFARFANTDNTIIRTITVPSTYTGAGPQLGCDSVYKIVQGFQFVGSARASLFVGTFKNSTTYTTESSTIEDLGDPNPNVQSTTVKNKMGIAPGFEGNLGLAYDALFCTHYQFKVEAGYRAQIYLNAIRSIDMGSEVALGPVGSLGSPDVGVYARTFERTVSDFSLAGPYLIITLGF
jgi:hypothetical protein